MLQNFQDVASRDRMPANSNPKPKSYALCPAIRLLNNGRALVTQASCVNYGSGNWLIWWLCH